MLWLQAATPNKRGRVDTIATLATDDEAVEAGEGEAKSESDTEQLDLIKLSGRGRGRGRRGGRGEGRGGSKQLVSLQAFKLVIAASYSKLRQNCFQQVAAKTLMSLPAGLPFNMVSLGLSVFYCCVLFLTVCPLLLLQGSGAAFMEASTFFQLQQQSYEMEMKRQKDQLELDKQRTAFQLDSMKAAAEVKKTELEIKQQELALQIKELEMLRQKQVVPTTDGPNTVRNSNVQSLLFQMVN